MPCLSPLAAPGVRAVLVLLLGALPCRAQELPVQPEEEVRAVVRAFHAAMEAGDTSEVLGLLAEDAVVLEDGLIEGREEYRSGHLGRDARVAREVPGRRGEVVVTISGNAAWAYSSSVLRGNLDGRPVSSRTAELMVLTRGEGGRWTIRALHWSTMPPDRLPGPQGTASEVGGVPS